MKLEKHPLVDTDIASIRDHILLSTDRDFDAAFRRLQEIERVLQAILENPQSGNRLDGNLDGCIVRHGGRDNKLTVVFEVITERHIVRILLIAFGGQNWMEHAAYRV